MAKDSFRQLDSKPNIEDKIGGQSREGGGQTRTQNLVFPVMPKRSVISPNVAMRYPTL